MDEITTTGETYVAKLQNGKITEEILTPNDFGLHTANAQDLTGGEPDVNARALLDVMNGKKSAYRDIVLANCAAVLMVSEKAADLKAAMQLASQAIDSGRALALLNDYKNYTIEHGKKHSS